ncbi:hypothetical protein BGX38DRAFT_1232953, partial [Terfezia claveryi]
TYSSSGLPTLFPPSLPVTVLHMVYVSKLVLLYYAKTDSLFSSWLYYIRFGSLFQTFLFLTLLSYSILL